MNDKQKILLALCLSTILTACSTVPLGTLWKLRNFDPLDANPGAIRIAVITDQAVQLKDNAVSMTLSFDSAYPDYNFANTSNATVKPNAQIEELSHVASVNQRITLFYFEEEAAHIMRLSQNRIRIIKENEIEGRDSLGISVNTGCFNGPKPDALLATVYATFAPNEGYIKMISNVDLLNEVDNKNQASFWLECSDTKISTAK